METIWKARDLGREDGETLVEEIVMDCGVSPLTASILIKRGCGSAEEAMAFLEPDWEDLHDPFLLPDMSVAVERILTARESGETICVYGDYDADGTTAVSILLGYFKEIGIHAFFRIPNRLEEGYGMNTTALAEVKAAGASLIITVDNGISAVEEVAFCNAQGMDVIVTDHHECQAALPEALAIIDAKRPDSQYPFSELCGAGIAFKLVQALDQAQGGDGDLMGYLECAALATVADIVPLKDENRVMVSLGIRTMNEGPLMPGIAALMAVSEIEVVNAGNIGFVLAPKINAAGRLGEAGRVVDLYLAETISEAMPIACFLRDENKKRQDIEQEIQIAAEKKVAAEGLYNHLFMVVAGEGWHSGVIGIVASKIQEKWYHPVIVMGIGEDGIAKGSCRSVPGIDIFAALSSCAPLFESFGGHEQAAGFSLAADRIPELVKGLEAWGRAAGARGHLKKTLYYDGEITADAVDEGLMEELSLCEPYGIGNPGPVFKMGEVNATDVRRMGKNQDHLSFTVDGLRCVGFGLGECDARVRSGAVSLLCKLKINAFNGNETIQPMVIDLKGDPLMDHQQAWEWVAALKKEEGESLRALPIWHYPCNRLLPERNALIAVYKMMDFEKIRALPFDDVLSHCPGMNSFQLLVGLNALNEVGLIEFKLKRGVIYGKKCKTNEKKDIQKAPLVLKLKKYLGSTD
ncbi:single-stranded-DNA-specific exonuclease RecJ [Eubacterium aggregans]|uniref:Single-stranded-DNA-specific exonuclease RecJ n=1 Tax=Eubacterium aggregans TaxID=81409 RepID=A0A1H4A5A7_9FIRM|nr:single-stranded-DNA-specific exonuclease RecJ [Eubacterium aggregans]MDD4690936.1 single-stranded-DNA-specific exonuclease RecJ [Eubacterium aggregans]SEA31146.1 exonuclease RecJ [Eubacterium aggregans]